MPIKKPNDLAEGMILAADVHNLDGQVLFTKGFEIKTRHIEILQMWGIPNVEIEGEEEEEDRINLDQFPPHILAKAEAMVASKFKLVKSTHPATEIIRKLCALGHAKAFLKEERAGK